MSESPWVGSAAPGAFAVVVPVDLQGEVRVIDWPGGEALSTLYREIGCRTVDIRTVGDLAFWVDDEGAVVADWAANGRATWLACVVDGRGLLVAGTVVVTLAAPDEQGDTRGLARELAERVAATCRAVPVHDPDRLTARLREVVDRGALVMTLDADGVPDGFAV